MAPNLEIFRMFWSINCQRIYCILETYFCYTFIPKKLIEEQTEWLQILAYNDEWSQCCRISRKDLWKNSENGSSKLGSMFWNFCKVLSCPNNWHAISYGKRYLRNGANTLLKIDNNVKMKKFYSIKHNGCHASIFTISNISAARILPISRNKKFDGYIYKRSPNW